MTSIFRVKTSMTNSIAAALFVGLVLGFGWAVWISSRHQPSHSDTTEKRAYSDKSHEQHGPVWDWITHDAVGFFTFWLVLVGLS